MFVIANLVVSLTISRMNYNSETETTPVIRILRLENTALIWTTSSAGSLYKDMERGSFVPVLCLPSPCKHIHFFTVIRAYFFSIPTYTEDQLRPPALLD